MKALKKTKRVAAYRYKNDCAEIQRDFTQIETSRRT